MEANLILRTQHLPAMRHHKNVVVHSSVRLPALQVKVVPPPGSARVAVVGAGVVLACALGAMYWKRAQALPMHLSSLSCHAGKNDNRDNIIASGDIRPEDFPYLLSEKCTGTSNRKPPRLTNLLNKCLTDEEKKNVLLKKFEEPIKTKLGEVDYYRGLVLIIVLINEDEYGKAKDICKTIERIEIPDDPRRKVLLAIIKKMKAMKMQSPNTPGTFNLETMRKLVGEATEKIEETGKKETGFTLPTKGPPDTN